MSNKHAMTIQEAHEAAQHAIKDGLLGKFPVACIVFSEALNGAGVAAMSVQDNMANFNKAINFAIDECKDPEEGVEFLKMWREGLWSEIAEAWPNFNKA
jgi:hypothetical protein